jgi:hypothetical protein
VLHRLAHRPLAGGGGAVEERRRGRDEQPAQITEDGLRERQDALGFARRRQGLDERGLLLVQRVEERIPDIGRTLVGPRPGLGELRVGEARETLERRVERDRDYRARASVFDSRSITLSSA